MSHAAYGSNQLPIFRDHWVIFIIIQEHAKNNATENGGIPVKKDSGNSRRVDARVYSQAERLKAKKKVVRMLIVIVVRSI